MKKFLLTLIFILKSSLAVDCTDVMYSLLKIDYRVRSISDSNLSIPLDRKYIDINGWRDQVDAFRMFQQTVEEELNFSSSVRINDYISALKLIDVDDYAYVVQDSYDHYLDYLTFEIKRLNKLFDSLVFRHNVIGSRLKRFGSLSYSEKKEYSDLKKQLKDVEELGRRYLISLNYYGYSDEHIYDFVVDVLNFIMES